MQLPPLSTSNHAQRQTTRWGPPRLLVTPSIGDLPPPAVPPPSPDPDALPPVADLLSPPVATESASEWTLRFDGACQRNPGPGGAGAALYDPSGAVAWTCAHFLSSRETNNTAEYNALLCGLESAVHHGVTRLRIEGDSHLVLAQVRGTFACSNRRLRVMRNRVQALLKRLDRHVLAHIDRKANAQADRLANRGVDSKKTKCVCSLHASDMQNCWSPQQPSEADDASSTARAPVAPATDHAPREHGDVDDDAEAEIAARDDGVLFPVLPIRDGSAPRKQPRLRLRAMNDDDFDVAAAAVETMANALASKIADAGDWLTGEGYIGAITDHLRAALAPFTVVQSNPLHHASSRPQHRPPRTTRHHREHRLDEALDDLEAVQRATPSDQRVIQKGRRRVARIRSAVDQSKLRQRFATHERETVERILRSASPETADSADANDGVDSGDCPIDRDELAEYFRAVNAPPRRPFDYTSAEGADFRAALAALAPPELAADAFSEEITIDEVEDQLTHVNAASAPGMDGVGYDVYKRFAQQLLPILHAAYSFCWRHQRVPALWKVGLVRLIHKKGDRSKPANWRPICLQQAIYKIYSGLLGRRLTRWLEANERFTTAQKGFRAMNGCHEHNFVASSLLDQTRRLHRKLYVVWYDLANAFGSLPQQLMWDVLRALGVDTTFISRCRDIYSDSHFVIGNGAGGATDPIEQSVGVYQGCPLSPQLFIAALIPLMRALERLPGTGVQLAADARPRATAYADDIKVFSDSAAGIKQCHDVVARFLAWTGLRANPAKCAMLAVTTNARGNPERDDLVLRVHDDVIPQLSLAESYNYLGVGDGFDHVQHRLQLAPKLSELKRDAITLLRSPLAPWQILKAIKTYLYPRVEYAMRHLRPLQSQLEGFDRALVKGFRHLLRLPVNATTEFFFAPASSGGLGLLSLVELHKALQVAHAWQMLHSRDPSIRAIARAQVRQVAQQRYKLDEQHWKERDDELVTLFLNSKLADSAHATPKRRNGDIGSLWTDVQRHLRTMSLRLETRETAATDDTPVSTELLHLRAPHHRHWLNHKTVLRHVKLHLKLQHLHKWKHMVDQGRTVRTQGQAGSKFVTTGSGLWDADYRFAFQARLNQLDTYSVLKRKRLRANATCRQPGCSRAETTAHVLQHCAGNMDAIRKRHDDALARIGTAIREVVTGARGTKELRLNQTVPGFVGPALRPDIQLFDAATRTATVLDLAITHEEQTTDQQDSSTLHFAREHKIAKYAPIKRHLERAGWRVHLSALVYGSLGAVAAGNFAEYTEHLGLLKRDARRLDQRLCTENIKASRRIWNWHCSQHRTRQQARTGQGTGQRAQAEGGQAAQQ